MSFGVLMMVDERYVLETTCMYELEEETRTLVKSLVKRSVNMKLTTYFCTIIDCELDITPYYHVPLLHRSP